MTEPMALALLALAGAAIARAAGVRDRFGMVALALPLGLFAYVIIGAILLMVRIPAFPWVTVGMLTFFAVAWLTYTQYRVITPGVIIAWLAGTLLVFAAAQGISGFQRVTITVDSFRYLAAGAIFADRGDMAAASSYLLLTRGQAIPYMHSLAYASGSDFLHATKPLLAGSAYLMFMWFAGKTWRSHELKVPPLGWVLMATVGAAIISSPRFVFSATYVHTHLVFAIAVLVAAGMIWVSTLECSYGNAPELAMLLSLCVLVVSRPEGALFGLLLLVPIVSASGLGTRNRALLVIGFGVFLSAWNILGLGLAHRLEGSSLPTPVWTMAGLGFAVIAVGVGGWFNESWFTNRRVVVVGAHLGIWGAVAAFAARDTATIWRTVHASWINIYSTELGMQASGLWGHSFLLIAAFGFVALLISQGAPAALSFPVLVFPPYFLLLPFLRGSEYRIGPGDSGTRMLLHIVLVVGLWLVVAVARWAWQLGTDDRRMRAVGTSAKTE